MGLAVVGPCCSSSGDRVGHGKMAAASMSPRLIVPAARTIGIGSLTGEEMRCIRRATTRTDPDRFGS